MIPDKDLNPQPWLVFWLESIKASGYNRYIVLKMTHFITWRDSEGNEHKSWGYLHGAGDSALKDTLKTVGATYAEDDNIRMLIIPVNENIAKEDYFEIGEGRLKEGYRVTGYDIHSTPGIEYVSLNPMYIKDNTPAPVPKPEDKEEDFYWLNGGKS